MKSQGAKQVWNHGFPFSMPEESAKFLHTLRRQLIVFSYLRVSLGHARATPMNRGIGREQWQAGELLAGLPSWSTKDLSAYDVQAER